MSTIKNHINTYANTTAYDNDLNKDYPNVSYIEEDDIVLFEGEIRYEEQYFTIESLEDDNDVKFKLDSESHTPSTSSAKTISVSTDDGKTWTDYTSTADGTTIATLNMGEKVLIKGNNDTYYSSDDWMSSSNCFRASNQIDVYGNIMSLIYGDNFKEQYSFPSETTYNFAYMFYNSTVVSAENLILPATTLTTQCYYNMFEECTSLTTAPQLPATTLATECYQGMFDGCTSLVNAPELPATTLVQNCYSYMFQGCTSLVNAPALPAITLADYCYYYMFNGCSSLTTAPSVLPATTLAEYCYASMFQNCTSLVNAPALPATELAIICYQEMFFGCTALTTAPALPARTLTDGCYGGMFDGCTGLTSAPELPATTLANSCYQNMFYGCSSLTTAPKLPATTLVQNCYSYMFGGCESLTTAPQLPATTLANQCYYGMFYNCTSLVNAPALPARTLANYCYNNMFLNCTKLNYIKAMFTTTPSTTYTENWVKGVSATGTFVKNSAASWDVTGVNGVPTGWTVQKASS